MKLKLARNHQYTALQVGMIEPYLGRVLTVGELSELARLVPVAIVGTESDDTTLAVDNAHTW